uniref:Complement component c3a, duplicate 5 n=1 Tax=Salarias fasciatus TaxID=181472 RepID=A0A672G1T4_SALFA
MIYENTEEQHWLDCSALSPLCSKVMSAPNLLRVETTENIFVECQDCTGGDIKVQINVMTHPRRDEILDSTSVTLTSANNYQMFGQLAGTKFIKDPNEKQYVYLQAQFDDRLLEKVVLVSFQSGYIFIQTDKTLYTPNSKGKSEMPLKWDDTSSIAIEIVVIPGLWKVVARFQSNPQQSYSADFEVKEYVLPSFEVKLKPQDSYFYVDSNDLTVEIKATYLFGKEVDGTAYVVFGVMQDGQKKSFPSSLQRVQRGDGKATLKSEHITQVFPNIQELVGDSIFVSVSVLTESGSEMVEAEVRGIQIVTSPYTIHFKKTPRYFKPGMSFDVTVEVLNPDQTPATDVQVVVLPGEVQGITGKNGVARLTVNTQGNIRTLDISARTADPRLPLKRQAEARMTAQSYTTNTARYIHIGVDSADLQKGNNLKVNLNFNNLPNGERDITYLILARGQLVKFGRYKTQGQVLISLNVPITEMMLPSFRIVAYYHPSDNEVVSDSVWVDVKDSCMGSVRSDGDLPFVIFSLVHSKSRSCVFASQVWDKVEEHDTGCTPGGGKDSMGVFYDAGLMFESNTASGTPYRQGDNPCQCITPPPTPQLHSLILDKYKSNKLQKECCMDGMSETPLRYSCERRSEYIVDGPACVEAFLDCCREMTTQRADKKEESLKLARSEEDDESYLDSVDIVTRSSFPESWLWTDVELPECRAGRKSVPLPDSITTWQLTGISLSRTHGICVGEPLEVIVWKEFFIDLRLPYSAVRGEQLEIKAILHNYSPDKITVRVDLTEAQHVCSAASKRGRYRQEVNVGPQTTRSVPFVIIPMKEGEVQIEVKAAVRDSSLSDGILKMLRVVVRDIDTLLLLSTEWEELISCFNKKKKKKLHILNSQIPKKDMIPNSPTSTHISVTEDVSALVENAISGKSMGTLIYQPSGCGEQNMIHMTLPVIATIYLDRTNQWEAVGFQKRDEALQHIKTGYNRELTFRKNDGSFAVWAKRPSSSWLTAYVAKVFAMAHGLVAVQEEHICDAIKYLILNAQQPDGMFREIGTVAHGEMIGDVKGTDSDASMTAFNLIAMQESRAICGATSLPNSIDKAVAYLENRLEGLTNPYAVAMTSYALANEGKLNREILYKFVSPGAFTLEYNGQIFTHFHSQYFNVYQDLQSFNSHDDARPVVRWFNQQQFVGGGYGSTQSTVMVYQAVSEYWINAKEPEYDLNVDILMPGRAKPDKFNFNRENHYQTRTSKVETHSFIDIHKTRSCLLTFLSLCLMVSLYYALPKEKESDCQRFNMSVELIPGNPVLSVFSYLSRDATMSILDIGLLTGFTVDKDDLDRLSKGRARTIAKYEMNTVLSERGSLIIYLDKVSHTRPEEISFRIRQTLKVGVLQPAAVSVYEYYNETQCVKFYHPERKAGQLLRLCRNDECTCAEENCSMQKMGKISNDERTAKICEATLTTYKVQLEEMVADLSTDSYTMRILDVIKEGNTDIGPMGKLRTFLSYQHCREALGLQKGKTYLIMGSSKDIHRDDQEFQYVLGERTWVEYWPTRAECQTDEHRPSCLGLDEMVDHKEMALHWS